VVYSCCGFFFPATSPSLGVSWFADPPPLFPPMVLLSARHILGRIKIFSLVLSASSCHLAFFPLGGIFLSKFFPRQGAVVPCNLSPPPFTGDKETDPSSPLSLLVPLLLEFQFFSLCFSPYAACPLSRYLVNHQFPSQSKFSVAETLPPGSLNFLRPPLSSK